MKERFFILLSFMSLIMIAFLPDIKAMQADAAVQTEREDYTGSIRPAPLTQSLVEDSRKFLKRMEMGKKRAISQPTNILIPFVEHLKSYVEDLPQTPQRLEILEEVEFKFKTQKVNVVWLLGTFFKAAALYGEPSEEEIMFFKSVTSDAEKELVEGLRDPEAWENIFTNFFERDNIDLPDVIKPYGSYIQDQLSKHLTPAIYWPYPTDDKFEVPFLLKSFLRDAYPVALSKKRVRAHGIDFSAIGFALHDLLHGTQERSEKIEALYHHIVRQTEIHLALGGDAREFIKRYTPFAVRSYERIMEALQGICDGLEASHDEKALAGFILMNHEYSTYNVSDEKSVLRGDDFEQKGRDIFQQGDLSQLVDSLVRASQMVLLSDSMWVSPEDPLETSPLDGKSALAERDIKEIVRYDLFQLPRSDEVRPSEIQEQLGRQSISTTSGFISIKFEWRSGAVERMFYPTLLHKLNNMDDLISLLKYAGIEIKKPDLSGIFDLKLQREMVQHSLVQVREELKKLMDHFKDMTHVTLTRLGIGMRFFEEHQSQDEAFKLELRQMLTSHAASVFVS